jgi:hypothetical protein
LYRIADRVRTSIIGGGSAHAADFRKQSGRGLIIAATPYGAWIFTFIYGHLAPQWKPRLRVSYRQARNEL